MVDPRHSAAAARSCIHAGALLFAIALAGCAQSTHRSESGASAGTANASRVPEQVRPDLYPNGAAPVPEPVVRYGRYTLVSTSPRAEQRDLLSQIIDVTVPQSMNPSVHDAMRYVLQRSGYRLCPATDEIKVLYGLPLPASQYQLGPMTLRNTVQVLAGPAWQVIVDEVSRNICFEKRPGYERIATPAPLVNASATQVEGGAR